VAKFAFLAAGNDGSSNYRSLLPALAVSWLRPKTHGSEIARTRRPHTVHVGQQFDDDMINADVIIGMRVAHPNAMPAWRKLREDGKRLVLDLDDDYFHIDVSNGSAYAFWSTEILRNLRESIELSDVVTVCSQALAESIARTTKHPNIKVVENALDAGINGIPRDYDPELLTVGWAGTENTAAWLPIIKEAINKAARDDYGKRVFVEFIGCPASYAANMGFRFRRGFGRCITFIPQPQEYLSELRRIDVLLAPYRSTPFTEAKFPTKGLEAGFLGIPLIASAIRPYCEWITHGKNGFLVPNNRQHEWVRYTSALVQDAALRRKMGLAARARASRNSLQGYLGVAWEEAALG